MHNASQPSSEADPKNKSLVRALRANAAFSAVCGLICLEAASTLGPWLGLDPGLLFSLGVDLEIFSVALLFLSSRDLSSHRSSTWSRRAVDVVIALDVLWVLGSVAAITVAPSLTTAGRWTVGLVALAVADFAFFQWRARPGRATSKGETTAPQAEPISA